MRFVHDLNNGVGNQHPFPLVLLDRLLPVLASFVFTSSFLTPLVSEFALFFFWGLLLVVVILDFRVLEAALEAGFGGSSDLMSSSSSSLGTASFFAFPFLLFEGGLAFAPSVEDSSFLVPPRFLLFEGLGSDSVSTSSSSSVSSFFLFEDFFAAVDLTISLSPSSSTSFDTGPVFFCTLGTTQLVLPPTVRNLNVRPLGKVVLLSFLPLVHRCLKSHSSGNLLESERCSTAKPQT